MNADRFSHPLSLILKTLGDIDTSTTILAGVFWSILHLVSHGKSVLDYLGCWCDIIHLQGIPTDLTLKQVCPSPQHISQIDPMTSTKLWSPRQLRLTRHGASLPPACATASSAALLMPLVPYLRGQPQHHIQPRLLLTHRKRVVQPRPEPPCLNAVPTQSQATRGTPAQGRARPAACARSHRMTPLRAVRPPLPARASPAPGRSSVTCVGPWESKERAASLSLRMLDHQCFPNAELEKLIVIPNSLPLANSGLSRFATGMSAPPSAGGTRRRRLVRPPVRGDRRGAV
ncbi:hypothetical protein B0H14DRAFT_3145741 [Mycena olivaceomarginata]|nr:hypothetical protein B0H14DRAFT_3145741 [Mycena olivaceomarginata]